MKEIILAFFLLVVIVSNGQRSTILVNDESLFHRRATLRADDPIASDTSWRPVQLPHNWWIKDFPRTTSPFHRGGVS